jgi:hypothetical protein
MSGRKAVGKRRRPDRRVAAPAHPAPGAAPGRPSDDPKVLRREARAQVRDQAAALRAHALPVEAEPAFVFRP